MIFGEAEDVMARCHELILQQRKAAFRNGPLPKVGAVFGSVLQCVAACCSVLQCVAVHVLRVL